MTERELEEITQEWCGDHCTTSDDKAQDIIIRLLAEVRFLRGQLADLCEDSRAVAEVARLRQACGDISHYIDNAVDALANYSPDWRGIGAELARIRVIAQRGLNRE